MDGKVEFPFYLRIPGWCQKPVITINGKQVEVAAEAGKYIRIERLWESGDIVEVTLPMRISVRTWTKNEDCVSIDRGPLTYSLKIGERVVQSDGRETIFDKKILTKKANFKDWPAIELFPSTPWNYGLVLEETLRFEERGWPKNNMPWTHAGTPVMLTARAQRIAGWKLQENNLAGAIQQSPIASDEPVETVTLLPMGACRLRISAFPTMGKGPDAKKWTDRGPSKEMNSLRRPTVSRW